MSVYFLCFCLVVFLIFREFSRILILNAVAASPSSSSSLFVSDVINVAITLMNPIMINHFMRLHSIKCTCASGLHLRCALERSQLGRIRRHSPPHHDTGDDVHFVAKGQTAHEEDHATADKKERKNNTQCAAQCCICIFTSYRDTY